MKPVYQVRDDDCLSACLASILELPLADIPVGEPKVKAWLAERGLQLTEYEEYPPVLFDIFHVISVQVASGERHCVVGYGGKSIFDPDPNAEEVVKTIHYEIIERA